MPKERALLLSDLTPLVLDGKKTQHRVVLRDQPEQVRWDQVPISRIHRDSTFRPGYIDEHGYEVRPRYAVGERLWVQEFWNTSGSKINYRASCEEPEVRQWRHALHMPRDASRLTLEITDHRIQKLQDISEADVLAEGCVPGEPMAALINGVPGTVVAFTPHRQFGFLWDALHARRQNQRWIDNPWVEAITFRVIAPAGPAVQDQTSHLGVSRE